MTVAEALGAHASAQIAAARAADEKRRVANEVDDGFVAQEPRSFVETWGVQAMVIGVARQH